MVVLYLCAGLISMLILIFAIAIRKSDCQEIFIINLCKVGYQFNHLIVVYQSVLNQLLEKHFSAI